MQVQDDPAAASDLDLRHYLRVVVRRRWVIIGAALVIGLASMAYALTKDDRYRASAELLLLAPTGPSAEAQSFSDDSERLVANEVEIFGSEEMEEAVAARIGGGFPGVSAAAKENADVIVLTAESTVPAQASDAVNAYAEAYQQLRLARTLRALRLELEDQQQRRAQKRAQLDELLAPLAAADRELATLPPGPERDLLQIERDATEERLSSLREGILGELNAIEQEITEIQDAIDSPTGGADILNSARVPSEPFYPQPKKDLLVGMLVGLLIGLAAAFVWEQLDDAVRGRADADRATGGLPVAGVVPKVAGWRNAGTPRLVTRDESRSAAAEAYRSLVTSLEFLATDGSQSVILVSSPGASEGKTTTVANLGLAFAEAGHRTVIVDGDLRRPRLHAFFDLSAAVGLTTVLAGKIDIATAVARVDETHDLFVVPAGPPAPNPAELLRSETTGEVVAKLRESYDIVLVDAPPVLPVTDALVLGRHADTVVLLAAADSTSRRKLTRAVEALRQVEAPLRALVLNGVGADEGDEYGYYGDEAADPNRKRRLRGRRSARD